MIQYWWVFYLISCFFMMRIFARRLIEQDGMPKGLAAFVGMYGALVWPATLLAVGVIKGYKAGPHRIDRIFIAAPKKPKRDELAELRERNAELERELDLV